MQCIPQGSNNYVKQLVCVCVCVCVPLLQVSDDSLHSIRCHSSGKMVACGSHSGAVTLLELSDPLSHIQLNEKANITAVSCPHQLSLSLSLFLSLSLSLPPFLSPSLLFPSSTYSTFSLSLTHPPTSLTLTYPHQIFERETRREKILEGRRREIKLKQKQAAAGGKAAEGGGGEGEPEGEEDLVTKAEEDFWAAITQVTLWQLLNVTQLYNVHTCTYST